MIRYDVEQGSQAWQQLRLGIPTASGFDEILTPKGAPSASQLKYQARLLAEWFCGYPLETEAQIAAMERGKRLEPEARALYEMERDVDVDIVGFCTTDDGLVGCSPDALVGEDGGAELKCPLIQTHMEYLLDLKALDTKYRHQTQGCLYVTGRKWWDLMSYCPGLPPALVRVVPVEAYQKALAAALGPFTEALEAAKQRLAPFQSADVGAMRRDLLAAVAA